MANAPSCQKINDNTLYKSLKLKKRNSNIITNALAVNNYNNDLYLNLSIHNWAGNIRVNVLSRRLRYPSANLGQSTATIYQ